MTTNDLLPRLARLDAVLPECADTRTFVLTLADPLPALDVAQPGQFVMLSVFGHGEAAFTLSALPGRGAERGTVVITVRRVGELTGALFALAPGATVGVRGPFGRGFPDDADAEMDRPIVYVAGGCGLSALRSAIAVRVARRRGGTPLAIVYGAGEPAARIHRADLTSWRGLPDVHLIECVERPDPGWQGRVGAVLDFVDEAVARVGARRAAVCGPPVLLPLVAERLCRLGLDAAAIHIAIERYMKCGTGHCGHCYVGSRYVCTDGPVFPYAALRDLPDAFPALPQPGAAIA